jgi:hypothetical protein
VTLFVMALMNLVLKTLYLNNDVTLFLSQRILVPSQAKVPRNNLKAFIITEENYAKLSPPKLFLALVLLSIP